jgi:hypothetical protein
MRSRVVRSNARCVRQRYVPGEGSPEVDRHKDDEQKDRKGKRQLDEALTPNTSAGVQPCDGEH